MVILCKNTKKSQNVFPSLHIPIKHVTPFPVTFSPFTSHTQGMYYVFPRIHLEVYTETVPSCQHSSDMQVKFPQILQINFCIKHHVISFWFLHITASLPSNSTTNCFCLKEKAKTNSNFQSLHLYMKPNLKISLTIA